MDGIRCIVRCRSADFSVIRRNCIVIDSYEKSEGNFMKYETISDMICRNMIIGFERKLNPVDMTKLAPPCEYEYATCCEIK